MSAAFSVTPIGTIRSPYREKFAVPRQPGLVSSAIGELELHPPFNDPQALREIEQFSHLWLIFQFHECADAPWHPTVRPPRLGGNERVGVFASRSPFRPNGLGLSVVRLLGVHQQGARLWLELGGIDLVDGTPVVDIKPYIPFVDSQPEACGGFAPAPPPAMTVAFTPRAEADLLRHQAQHPRLRALVQEVLSQDPRPAYHQQQASEREYGVHLYDYNVRWQVEGRCNRVIAIENIE